MAGVQIVGELGLPSVAWIPNTRTAGPRFQSFSSSGDASITFGSETKVWRAETHATEEEMDDGDSWVDPDPV
ncbi:hypothetical protein [Halorhabdus sp. BNX81]|uniref:hypothetical protein n=1 Tax=Halorhabdus sp. BNX81 TaxID=2980181 RepID=UPI0023DD0581|nr:hypothetical protein [Halorhabdus sp. BNX81]